MPTYKNSARQRYVRTTAFSHKECESGAVRNLTATGSELQYSNIRSVAADWSRYPIDTTFNIKGLPYTYVVDDFGSALCGTNTLDLYFPTLHEMDRWGNRDVEIRVAKWGSWRRSAEILRPRRRFWHCRRMYSSLEGQLAKADAPPTKSDNKPESPEPSSLSPSPHAEKETSSFTWNLSTSPKQRAAAQLKEQQQRKAKDTIKVANSDSKEEEDLSM